MLELRGAPPGELPAGLLSRVREMYEVGAGGVSAGAVASAAGCFASAGANADVDAGACAGPARRGVWRAPVVIIDGRSGSGKSTLGATLARHLRMAGVRNLQETGPDQWYPGWYGLAQGTQMLVELLSGTPALRPASMSGVPRDNGTRGYRVWDWEHSRPGQYVRLDRDRPLLIEGSGSLCPATAIAADLRIWVECGPELRRRRAIERDGATYEPWWDVWAAQEDEHIRVNQPQRLADVVVYSM